MGRLFFAAVAAAACVGGPVRSEPRADVQGEMDAALREVIIRAVGVADTPIENRFEARRRARTAADDAAQALHSEGYYGHQVDPDVTDTEPPRAVIRVTPGRRFVVGRVGIDWQGAAPDPEAASAAEAALSLPAGMPARAAEVIAAEGRAVAAITAKGYADAETQDREVIVDHADGTLKPTYRITSGPKVRLDGVEVSGPGRTDPDWVKRLAPWTSGDVYRPDAVAELERRLLDTGVYDTVTVALAAPRDGVPLRPVVVGLEDRKPRTIETQASYATTDGAGVTARWTHYNRLGRADMVSLLGQLSQRDSRGEVELSLPHWRRPQQTLRLATSAYREQTDAFDQTGAGLRADVTRRYGRTSYATLGASADFGRTDELSARTNSPLGRDLVTVAMLGDVALDRSNDPLNPTRGWRVSGRLEPTVILGDTNLPYLRAVAQGTYYQPLDARAATVLAGRLRLGRIVNGTVDQIPASQRFYAGGGGSVRGFPLQAVGPRLSDNTPRGGVFLFESAFEVRRDLTERWGFAAFVDAGAVGSSGAVDFGDLAVGAGVGVRYNLGFAPIRIDVATPVKRRRGEPPFQLYLSIGQSF